MTLLTAAVALLALAMCAGGWLLWRIGGVLRRVDQNQQQTTAVLRELHAEAQKAAAEREQRRAREASDVFSGQEEVREARMVLKALDTNMKCYECREVIRKIRDQFHDYYRRTPEAPRP